MEVSYVVLGIVGFYVLGKLFPRSCFACSFFFFFFV